MSGKEQNSSSEKKECHHDKTDYIEEVVAAMARLSIGGRLCPPLSEACNKASKITTREPLSTSELTDAQVKPQEKHRDNVLSEEDIGQFVFLSINQEEPEPHDRQVKQRNECERTERADVPKVRRGGVLHKSENNCCPVLTSSLPWPRSHMDLQMEDIRAAGRKLRPRSC
ncbi:hypothetical protein FQN60_005564 [Etheostoma spectabile]|uniref:Uncharacterized protein n=1 Tax=Etheostoma spectabile TaxID=54343 RepID=A0A5J5CHQ0_9PERO|nr:hypothetical protein FQN60_005564 [Etheostoma spectabile]